MEICFFHFCRFHLQLTVCGREEIEKNVGADVELDVYRSDDQLQVARERHMAGLPKQEVFTWDRDQSVHGRWMIFQVTFRLRENGSCQGTRQAPSQPIIGAKRQIDGSKARCLGN
jgi:hypothetical protein